MCEGCQSLHGRTGVSDQNSTEPSHFRMGNERPTSYSPLAGWDKRGVAPPSEGDFIDMGGFSSPLGKTPYSLIQHA